MARARDPNRDKAYNLWKERNGEITNREDSKSTRYSREESGCLEVS